MTTSSLTSERVLTITITGQGAHHCYRFRVEEGLRVVPFANSKESSITGANSSLSDTIVWEGLDSDCNLLAFVKSGLLTSPS